MRLRLLTHVLSCLVCLSCIAVSSASEHKPIKASKFKITAKPGAGNSIADMAGANFYITTDKGQSWQQIAHDKVVHEDGKAPFFIFEAKKDGLYGFWIQVLFVNGSMDDEPKPGSPAPFMRLIDTTPPKIEGFSAGLITGIAGSQPEIFTEWSASDIHLGKKSVAIEYSTNDEDWKVLQKDLSARGKDMFDLPTSTPFSVRLHVTDTAGNKASSDVIVIGQASKSNNTTAETAEKPAATLPSLDEIDQDVEKELAQKNGAATATKKEKAEPRPVVPPDHKDIIAPYANKPWPTEKPPEQDATTASTATETAAPKNSPKLIDSQIALILERRKGRILFGKDAEKVLDAARTAVMQDNNERAQVLYARLKDSTVASEALPEEIELHLRLDHLDIARELVRTAPPEIRNTKMRIQQASLYLIDKKRKQAISLLTGLIPDQTDDYRNAQLLLARCYIEDGKQNSALTILRPMAQNQDSWGQAAQALLDQINN